MDVPPIPTLDDVRRAAERIGPHAHRTPVLTCAALDGLTRATLYFKCENLQKVGAFKFRGATNAVMSLTEEAAQRGVATHSSGNHAAALALAARNRGIPAHVVMPRTAPAVKKAAVAGYGAHIVECAPTLEARETTLDRVVADTGATFIHPYNDPRVVAGAGTAALELLTDHPDLDVIMAPVGGGGLMSGTAIAARGLSAQIRIIGAEPELADDAHRSLQAGEIIPSVNPQTICDGLLTSLGPLSFTVLSRLLESIITVSEAAIVQAMRHTWERMKILIEPSSAVPLGALLAWKSHQLPPVRSSPAPLRTSRALGNTAGIPCGRGRPQESRVLRDRTTPGEISRLEAKQDLAGQRIGIILSGGNVNLDQLPWSGNGG